MPPIDSESTQSESKKTFKLVALLMVFIGMAGWGTFVELIVQQEKYYRLLSFDRTPDPEVGIGEFRAVDGSIRSESSLRSTPFEFIFNAFLAFFSFPSVLARTYYQRPHVMFLFFLAESIVFLVGYNIYKKERAIEERESTQM